MHFYSDILCLTSTDINLHFYPIVGFSLAFILQNAIKMGILPLVLVQEGMFLVEVK